jgi:hypothetical protein
MITVFCDFRQFSAEKMAFFLKPNAPVQILQKPINGLNKKYANFFARKYF